MDFRTAGLTVSASLGECAFFIGTRASGSLYAGVKIGDAITYILQTYYPDAYNTLGGTLAQMVEQLNNATTDAQRLQIIEAIFALVGATYNTSATAPPGAVPFYGIFFGAQSAQQILDGLESWVSSIIPTITVAPILIP